MPLSDVISVRFTTAQRAALKAEHERTGRMVTEIIRRAVDEYLKVYEDAVKAGFAATPKPPVPPSLKQKELVYTDPFAGRHIEARPGVPSGRPEPAGSSPPEDLAAVPDFIKKPAPSRFSRGVKIRRR